MSDDPAPWNANAGRFDTPSSRAVTRHEAAEELERLGLRPDQVEAARFGRRVERITGKPIRVVILDDPPERYHGVEPIRPRSYDSRPGRRIRKPRETGA